MWFWDEHKNNPNNNKQSTRRGKRTNAKKAITKLRLRTINTRGIRSKLTSLTAALHTHSTHIAAITETHLNAKNEVSVTGYQWLGKNRTDREGGGVGFLIRNDIKDKVQIIDTTEGTDSEILWIKLKSSTNIAIATMYGKQETSPKDTIENQFEELTTQVNQLQQENHIIIMGDLNAKVEVDRGGIKQTASRNGLLLTEFTHQTNTAIINTTPNHQGSWTRVQGRIQVFFPGGVRWDQTHCHRDAAGVSAEGTEGGLGGLHQENFEYEVL